MKKPKKLQKEINHLIHTNPRDPVFYRQSPKKARRYIVYTSSQQHSNNVRICRVIESAKERLKYISERNDGIDLSNNEQLPETLLDLANYKYDDLVQRSLLLLDRFYTSQTDILKKALQTQLLKTEKSNELHNRINKMFLRLVAFFRSGTGASVDADGGPSPVEVLTEYCWLENEVEGFEPHQINQNIILSFGMLHITI